MTTGRMLLLLSCILEMYFAIASEFTFLRAIKYTSNRKDTVADFGEIWTRITQIIGKSYLGFCPPMLSHTNAPIWPSLHPFVCLCPERRVESYPRAIDELAEAVRTKEPQ